MKRRILIKKLLQNGWQFLEHASNHYAYIKGNKKEFIGRHTEIDEPLAKKILKRNGIK